MDLDKYLDDMVGSVWRIDAHMSSAQDVEVRGRGTRNGGQEVVLQVREVMPGGFHKDPLHSVSLVSFIEHATLICSAGSDARKDYDKGHVPCRAPAVLAHR